MIAAGYARDNPARATKNNVRAFLLQAKKPENHFLKKLMANKAVFEVVQKDLKTMLDVDIDQSTDLGDIERFYDQAQRVRDRARQKLHTQPKRNNRCFQTSILEGWVNRLTSCIQQSHVAFAAWSRWRLHHGPRLNTRIF